MVAVAPTVRRFEVTGQVPPFVAEVRVRAVVCRKDQLARFQRTGETLDIACAEPLAQRTAGCERAGLPGALAAAHQDAEDKRRECQAQSPTEPHGYSSRNATAGET